MKISTVALVGTIAAATVLGAVVTSTTAQAAEQQHSVVQPPKPGAQDHSRSTDSVPGLTRAVQAAPHPGLALCGGAYSSLVTASGHLRGDRGTQYLVDTTCAGATASTPDEVVLYEARSGKLGRSAVLSSATARPLTTAYPYIWQQHTVVLTYGGGTHYRLVRLAPTSVSTGPVVAFH